MGRDGLLFVLDVVGPDLTRHNNRGNPVPIVYQLLSALRYLASGEFQNEVGDTFVLQISQPTVSRSVASVTR